MKPERGRWALGAVVLILALGFGAVAGGAAGLLAQQDSDTTGSTPSGTIPPSASGEPTPSGEPIGPSPTAPSPLPPTRPLTFDTMLAWTPGGIPEGFAEDVGSLQGVDHAVPVVSGVAWMTRSWSPDGTPLERAPEGLAVPLDVAAASLTEYAPFLRGAERGHLTALARGEAVLGATSARLRRMPDGGMLRIGDTDLVVAGTVADESIGAHEIFVSRRTAVELGLTRERYVLIDPSPGARRDLLEARIRELVSSETPLRIRGPGETPYFRQGDAVLAPVRVKELFGEFAARPVGGYLDADPEWIARSIVTERVPILGMIECHKDVLPQIRGALREVQSRGLGHLIYPSQYGGCFSPRFANRDPDASISHHSWGMAIDINVATNRLNAVPQIDSRIVNIFERWGFGWGGDFLVPDGMHFEFLRYASGS